jgi:hypothetical protein
MPNHCSNHLEVSGSVKEMKKFYDHLSFIPEQDQESYNFDFNDFIPMPKSLDIIAGSRVNRAVEVLNGEANMGSGGDYPNITPEDIELGKTYLSNMKKYGHGDWYSWSNANWGTKWNAYDGYANSVEDDYFGVGFSTAWSPPMPLLAKICELFPNLTIQMEYQEEGMGFAGVAGSNPGEEPYDNEGEIVYLSSCCNKDVNEEVHMQECEDSDLENWEICPKCKEECESISEVIYNN